MTPRELHIVRGDSAGGTLKLALGLKTGNLLVSADSISYGPLPALTSLADWQHVRAEYWQNLDTTQSAFELAAEFDLLKNVDLLRESESIVLWIGTGPDEQLLLVWMVQLLRMIEVRLERFRVVQFDRVPPFD